MLSSRSTSQNNSTDAAQKAAQRCSTSHRPIKRTWSQACLSCHFDQNLKWRQTKHAKAFDILPAIEERRQLFEMPFHWRGEKTGYQGAKTSDLAGTSCEACHGPGSKHAQIAKGFGTNFPRMRRSTSAARSTRFCRAVSHAFPATSRKAMGGVRRCEIRRSEPPRS